MATVWLSFCKEKRRAAGTEGELLEIPITNFRGLDTLPFFQGKEGPAGKSWTNLLPSERGRQAFWDEVNAC